MSEVGRRHFPRYFHRQGVVVGESRDGKAWWIVFDGHCSRQILDKDLIEVETAGFADMRAS